MKKIVVVSRREWTGSIIKGQLESLLDGLVSVDSVSLDQGNITFIDADMVLVSNATIVGDIGRFFKDREPMC